MIDTEVLIRDKYNGDTSLVTEEDRSRLASGEPLAYVIGWIPFFGLHIDLSSRPLIPRPETEWWTERCIEHLREKFQNTSFTFLDLCAGSGAIGLAVLKTFPNAHVSFGEIDPEHCVQIQKNAELNSLDLSRMEIHTSDLFKNLHGSWDIIASNPPYIPSTRDLPESVMNYEPAIALYSGEDGLDVIRAIAQETKGHLNPQGEIWVEADISNIETTKSLLLEGGATRSEILIDQYGRERVVVSYFP